MSIAWCSLAPLLMASTWTSYTTILGSLIPSLPQSPLPGIWFDYWFNMQEELPFAHTMPKLPATRRPAPYKTFKQSAEVSPNVPDWATLAQIYSEGKEGSRWSSVHSHDCCIEEGRGNVIPYQICVWCWWGQRRQLKLAVSMSLGCIPE